MKLKIKKVKKQALIPTYASLAKYHRQLINLMVKILIKKPCLGGLIKTSYSNYLN